MIKNLSSGEVLVPRVERCDTFWSRGRGLMFRRRLSEDTALLFITGRESILDSAIHMLFVFFAIGVIWLDNEKRVVDKRVARPFGLYYAPQKPARYFVECHPKVLARVQIGDQLAF